MKKYNKFIVTSVGLLVVITLFILGGGFNKNQYVNEGGDFMFHYPKTWKEVKGTGLGGEVVTVMNRDGSKAISFAYADSLEEAPIATPINKRQNLKVSLDYFLKNIEAVTVGGVRGYRGNFYNETINYRGKEYYIEHDGHVYSFGYDQSLDNDREVTEIVNSFVFLK